MATVPTVRIANPQIPSGYVVINASDYDPAVHVLFGDDSVPQLRTDGPTFEEYVAAGYKPENYPPQGWAEKPSPGLEAYRATGTLAPAEPPATPEPVAAEVPATSIWTPTEPAEQAAAPDAAAEAPAVDQAATAPDEPRRKRK